MYKLQERLPFANVFKDDLTPFSPGKTQYQVKLTWMDCTIVATKSYGSTSTCEIYVDGSPFPMYHPLEDLLNNLASSIKVDGGKTTIVLDNNEFNHLYRHSRFFTKRKLTEISMDGEVHKIDLTAYSFDQTLVKQLSTILATLMCHINHY